MKKRIIWIVLVLSVFFLSGCKKEAAVLIQQPVKEVLPTKENLSTNQNFLLLQKSSEVFPQSQGVYDVIGEQLTIVKQYAPVVESEQAQGNSVALEQKKLDQIKQDFNQSFPSLSYEGDLYQVYEQKFHQTRVTLHEGYFTLSATPAFTQNFYFVGESDTQVKDENGTLYEIQYSN